MLPLVASLLPLLLGPLLFRLVHRLRAPILALDGFTFVAIGGLVILEILPQSYELAGWWALPVAVLGFAGPTLAERLRERVGHQLHTLALGIAISGLFVHGLVDGIALSQPPGESPALPLAVILHRLPEALAVWWLLRPRGRALPSLVLASLGVATVLGFGFGESMANHFHSRTLGLFEALVGGALMHVVAHSSRPLGVQEAPRGRRLASAGGALLAVGLLVVVRSTPHHHTHLGPLDLAHMHAHGIGENFLELALVSAPALVLGYLAAGLVHTLLPKASLAWLGRGSRWSQAARGVMFGLPLPICSCGVVPIYRGLVQQGAPLPASLALLVSAPELGLDAILLSIPLLGGELALYRVLAAAVLALLVAVIVSKLAGGPPQLVAPPSAAPRHAPLGERIVEGLRTGFGELVDHTAPWILVGLGVAAIAQPLLDQEWLRQLPTGLDVVCFALLGMPVYVCASGATPLAAVLIAQGVSPGAALAFLLTGPATNVTTFGILSRLHGRRLALAFAGTTAVLSVLLGLGVNALGTSAGAGHLHSHGHSAWEWVCLWILAGIYLLSLVREGPRAFVGEIFTFPGGESLTRDCASAQEPGHSHP